MYKCGDCGALFESTKEFEDYYSAENKTVVWDGCPECESADYQRVEFESCCPECGEIIIDDYAWKLRSSFWCDCKDCKKTYYIDFGDIMFEEDLKQ